MIRQQYHLHRHLLDTPTAAAAPPPNTGSRAASSTTYASDANFDTNMMVILAALLCALIGALGLNSVIRCALRCTQRFAIDDPDRVAARLASTGLSKNALNQIPVVVYQKQVETTATECCPICLGEFDGGEKVRILPKCGHGFHVKCIDKWLVSHSSCPNCRQMLFEQGSISNV